MISTELRYHAKTDLGSEVVEFNIATDDGYPTTVVVNANRLMQGSNTFPCGNGDDYTLAAYKISAIKRFINDNRKHTQKNNSD